MASTLSRKFNWSHFEEIIYRRWPDKYEHKAYEDTPLGIILCAGKNSEQEELLALGQAGIHVAECLPFLY